MVTVFDDVTDVVFTVNTAFEAPAATVTLVGTVAAALLLESATTAPPVGAPAVSATVPWEALPPTKKVGLTIRDDKAATGAGWLTLSEAVRVTPA